MTREEPPARESGVPTDETVDPPAGFVDQANIADPAVHAEADAAGHATWTAAADLLDWAEPYDAVLDGEEPPFEWFQGGELNACYNCVDRHLPERKNQLALVWEGRLGEQRNYTYRELHREVQAVAAGLRDLGVGQDDVVTLYMPMIPELPIAMLACARIGAPHNVVFAGFAADALATRMLRADSSFLVTCDGYYRRGQAVTRKNKADTATVAIDDDVTSVVVDRLGDAFQHSLGPDEHDYHDLVAAHEGTTVEPVARAATDDLFRIYTSGTTGQPKAVTHTTGGYLSYVAWTSHAVLDVKPRDTYWCSADIGWITGHSYIVYGPLALGTTTVMYEGAPDHPEKDRIWEILERLAVDVFYTSPTAIRAFMKWGEEYPADHDLSSLRLLGSVGEPINPRAWRWYFDHVGNGNCPIVDTWWQTETGGILVTTLPGVDEMKPGTAGPPLPGVGATVVDEQGDPAEAGEDGYLVIDEPWPAMPQELCRDEAWAATGGSAAPPLDRFDWCYPTEDGAVRDEDGYLTILGRMDDVITISGYRFGTNNLESAIVDVDGIAEAAVVEGPRQGDDRAVYAYVSTEDGHDPSPDLERAVTRAVTEAVGPLARPEGVVFSPELPKTRSGKIMRRLLEAVARGEDLGDTSALRNPEVVGELESELSALREP
jgi:acetyl-CoA synthetase